MHLRISCPPTASPCFYGVDTPTKRELIGANVEADTLGYLSLAGLREAVADNDCNYCYACYTGNHPTELVNIEELMTKRGERH